MIKILTLLTSLFLSQTIHASVASAPQQAVSTSQSQVDEKEPAIQHSEAGNYQQVIEEYKAYVATVDKGVRDEIVGFRKDMAKLNKQKHTIYKKLSQEAQHYLAKERELKRKLPLEQRKALKDEANESNAAEM